MSYDVATVTMATGRTFEEVRRVDSSTEIGVEGPAANYMKSFLEIVRLAVDEAGLRWHKPNVGGSPDEITVEWWNGARSLAIIVRGYQVEVLQVRGPNIDRDMKTLAVRSKDELAGAYRWLLEG